MRRLLFLLLLAFALPAFSSGLLDSRPSSTLGASALNNSNDFLPVREAFQLSLVQANEQNLTLRFVAADGYYLYRHRLQFHTEPADIGLGQARLPEGEKSTMSSSAMLRSITTYSTSKSRAQRVTRGHSPWS